MGRQQGHSAAAIPGREKDVKGVERYHREGLRLSQNSVYLLYFNLFGFLFPLLVNTAPKFTNFSSLSTYESKLRELGIRKKLKRADWTAVYEQLQSRGTRPSAVYLDGVRIPSTSARKEIRRSGAKVTKSSMTSLFRSEDEKTSSH